MADRFGSGAALASRLEMGEVVWDTVCPFALPSADVRAYLFAQKLAGRSHKNISYDPKTGRLAGFHRRSAADPTTLRDALAEFSRNATAWLRRILPSYAAAWRIDQASFRPEEEATRQLRVTARNDLLHVDAFPSRPTQGARILRLFVNLNPFEPRVWVTSETFTTLWRRYGQEVGYDDQRSGYWLSRMASFARRALLPNRADRSDYDDFMIRFHNFLKRNDAFQERCPKRYWSFPPGSAWLVMTDGISHAALRGRYALEHSYFITRSTLVCPEIAPATIFSNDVATPIIRRAA